jgi:feruloyl esterase
MRYPNAKGRLTLLGIPLLLAACGGGGGGGGVAIKLPEASTPPPAPVVSAADKCNSFTGTTLAGASLKEATLVPAAAGTVEYCRVTGTLHETLKFEVRLPTEWNKKQLYVGGGGWNGTLDLYVFDTTNSRNGYVLTSSNGGRDGSGLDASPFLNNPTTQADFGYLSVHSVKEVTNELVRKRYGSDAEFSYFEGCSNGGREALIQASRFPNDFDGIVVRSPAYSFTELFQGFIANAKAFAAPGAMINDAKAALISKTVTAQCDGLDGAADGIVSNPAACTFNPSVLRCAAGDADTCLTDAQIAAANTTYSELKRADGSSVYPGWGPGGEGDPGSWPSWISGTAVGGVGMQLQFGSGLVKYWITNDPAFDVLTFDPEIYSAELKLAATILDATPNLGSFFARGGKMVLAHGTTDWAISYKGSLKYFNDVATKVGGAAVRDASMEFFLEPGVQHCNGGVGPDMVDLLGATAKWRESGVKPSEQKLIAKKLDPATQTPVLTRPLCKYPSFPKYKGSGDLNAADSFTCQTS